MSRKRYSPEHIVEELRIAEHTYYRWRREYSGLSVDQAGRSKELKGENTRLRKLIAGQELDISTLKEAARGGY